MANCKDCKQEIDQDSYSADTCSVCLEENQVVNEEAAGYYNLAGLDENGERYAWDH